MRCRRGIRELDDSAQRSVQYPQNGQVCQAARLGLVPFWLKAEQLGQHPYSTINARSDRIRTAPTYREPFKTRRCLVPASGWYEWQKINAKTKRPSLQAEGRAVRLRWRV